MQFFKTEAFKKIEASKGGIKRKKKNPLKTFKNKFQRKLSSKTSFTSEKKILSTFTFQTRSAEEKTSQRE